MGPLIQLCTAPNLSSLLQRIVLHWGDYQLVDHWQLPPTSMQTGANAVGQRSRRRLWSLAPLADDGARHALVLFIDAPMNELPGQYLLGTVDAWGNLGRLFSVAKRPSREDLERLSETTTRPQPNYPEFGGEPFERD